jgi:hypothetical protein
VSLLRCAASTGRCRAGDLGRRALTAGARRGGSSLRPARPRTARPRCSWCSWQGAGWVHDEKSVVRDLRSGSRMSSGNARQGSVKILSCGSFHDGLTNTRTWVTRWDSTDPCRWIGNLWRDPFYRELRALTADPLLYPHVRYAMSAELALTEKTSLLMIAGQPFLSFWQGIRSPAMSGWQMGGSCGMARRRSFIPAR